MTDNNENDRQDDALSDDIVSMSSDLGFNLHPNADLPVNRAESKQQRNAGHVVYSIIAETVAYAKQLSENDKR